jgi:hypothetical protein
MAGFFDDVRQHGRNSKPVLLTASLELPAPYIWLLLSSTMINVKGS